VTESVLPGVRRNSHRWTTSNRSILTVSSGHRRTRPLRVMISRSGDVAKLSMKRPSYWTQGKFLKLV